MAKAKKKVTKKKAAKKLTEEEKARRRTKLQWEKAKAEVGDFELAGPPGRLIQLPREPDDLSTQERQHWIRKLRVEQGELSTWIEDLHGIQEFNKACEVSEYLDASYGDVLRLRFRSNIWNTLGHLERMVELDTPSELAREADDKADKLRLGLENMVRGLHLGLMHGCLITGAEKGEDECCPNCGSEDVEALDD